MFASTFIEASSFGSYFSGKLYTLRGRAATRRKKIRAGPLARSNAIKVPMRLLLIYGS